MPIGGGEYKPGDIVDVYALASDQTMNLQEDPEAMIETFQPPEDDTPSSSEINALGGRDWITSSIGRGIANLAAEDDPNFVQPWADLDEKYFPYRDLFEDAGSHQQWYTATTIADQDMYDSDMFNRMDAQDWSQYIGIQLADPLPLALSMGTSSFYAVGRGVSLARAAAKGSALTAAEMTAIEAVLQLSDPLRDIEDSALSIFAGGAFGALMSVGGQALSNKFSRANELKGEIYQVFKDEVDIQRANDAIPEGTTRAYTATDEKVKFNPLRYIIDNPVMRNAQIRMQYSGSPILSRMADKLGANNLIKNGDYNGTRYNGPTLNQTIKKTTRRSFRILSDLSHDAQKKLRKDGVKLSIDDISFRATAAARRGGAGDQYDEINRIGSQFNKDMKDWAERGIKMKVLTKETVDAMDNYVPRIYDRQMIMSRWDDWSAMLISHFRAKRPDLSENELAKIPRDIYNSINSLQMHERTMTSKPVGRGGTPKSGSLKARQLDDISEDLVSPFLVNDIRVLSNRYLMGAGSDIMMREQFGVDNILDLDGVPVPKQDYEAGMRELSDEFEAAKTLKQKNKIQKKMERLEDSIKNYMRSIMHRPVAPVSRLAHKRDEFIKGVRGYAASAQLGEVIESAFPDASNNILQHGMVNLLASLPTFFRSLPQVFKTSAGKGYASQHWRDMDVALDNLLSSNIMAIADVEDARMYGFKRGAWHGSEVARKAFRVFLADKWNTGAKLLAATTAERAILRDAAKMVKGTIGKQRGAKAHRIGMTKDVARRIDANNKKAGKRNGLAKVEDWDEATSGDLSRMIFRESEFQVVAPDAGEMPEMFDNEVGRLIMQFRTFMLSHTMKHLMPAAQRLAMGDMTVMASATAMTSLGIMSAFVKDVTRNQFDYEKVAQEWSEKSIQDIVAIGLDKGAVVSYVSEALGLLDNKLNGVLGENVGMTPRKSYYRSKLGVEESIPGLGYLGNVADAATSAARGALPEEFGGKEYTARDLNKVRRAMPLQNTFYLGWLFDLVSDYTAETFDLPESATSSKTEFKL